MPNPVDEKLLGHIRSNPGVTFSELQGSLQLPTGTLHRRLTVLVAGGLARDRRLGNRRHFFDADADAGRLDAVIALRDQRARHIVFFLHRRRGASQKEVLQECSLKGWKRSAVQQCIARLERAGVVSSLRARTMRYEVDADAMALLAPDN